MGIYIPNMKLPEACEDCPIYSKNSSKCLAVEPPRFFDPHELEWREPKPGDELGDKPSWCPLIEVPEHGRLGDLDALEEKMVYNYDVGADMLFDNDLYAAPTIIPADKEEET